MRSHSYTKKYKKLGELEMGVVVSTGKITQMLSPESTYTKKIYIKDTKEVIFGKIYVYTNVHTRTIKKQRGH